VRCRTLALAGAYGAAIAACLSLEGVSGDDQAAPDAGTEAEADAVGDGGIGVTDAGPDGACALDCGLGTCEQGVCRAFVVAHSAAKIDDLVCDGDGALYWTSSNVLKKKIWSSNDPPVSLATDAVKIAVDATHVYFVSGDAKKLERAPKIAGNTEGVFALAPDGGGFHRIAVADKVYTSLLDPGAVDSFEKMANVGSPTSTIAANNPQAVAADGTGLYYFDYSGGLHHKEPTGANVVISVGVGADPSTVIALDDAGPAWLADGRAVVRLDLATNAVTKLTTTAARGVALGETMAYVVFDDSIVALAKDGTGASVVIASAQSQPRTVVVCPRAVAWIAGDVAPNVEAVMAVAR